MSVVEFLAELSRHDVKVWADGNQLRYRAPEGVMTPALKEKLAEHKVGLLILLSQRQASNTSVSLPQVVPAPDQQYLPFPTTDVQQAYWIGRSPTFELGGVGNHGYMEIEAIDLDVARSVLVLRRLIERHPMLRAIILPDGQQQILEHVPPFQIKVIDLEGLDQQALDERLACIRHEMDHQVFQVEQWPAFEIRVSHLQERRVRIHASIESLFVDVWSIRILIQEFIYLYHEPDAYLPPLELSFRDYVLAEAKLQDSDLYRHSRDYWAERIQEFPLGPDLPLAIDPTALGQPCFVHREARMEAALWQRLRHRGARAGLTPSGILLAAFTEVLTTWSKTPRFCINLTTFNRLPLHKQVNDIVGDFTSLLMLAADNSLSASFEDRARSLQEQLWRDFDHRYYSGVRVLRDLARIQGNHARAIMPVVFTSLLDQNITTTYPAPWQKTIYCVTQTPQVWLDHQVLEEAGNLVLYWQTVEALFPPGLLDEMFEAYVRFLQRLATDDQVWQTNSCGLIPVSQLAQRTKINATEAPISDHLLHSFFIEQVAKSPDHIAVISAKRSLTYQEILNGATLLGHQLRQLGARPNHLVAVVMEKGWEQVVGVLGVLLSGAAYLPIDPKLPQERLTFLLEHGEAELVITQSWIEKAMQWPERLTPICVDALDLAGTDIKPLDNRQGPDDLAYVIYTSGSTGLPKGVMIDHRGAVNTILDINHRFGVTSEDRVLALSALNFDLSVYDIFGILAAGGTIVLPNEKTLRDPAAWLKMIEQEQVTIWNTVPALLQLLVEYAEVHSRSLSRSHLRLALLSGDWIPLALPEQLKNLCPDVEVVSLGGATEASIWSILYPITTVDPSWKSIPYGRPMNNQQFFVLSENFEPCPVWVPGQLYIAGSGLAKGYWRDEEKTQASFFEHPRTGVRLYRTGDLGRYLPDGTIEFLGREDFQVKVQGHRIELGEIEQTLLQHPAVQAAVATALTEPHGSKRLMAYVVLRSAQEVSDNGYHRSQDEVTAKSYTLEQLKGHSPVNSSYETLQRLTLRFGQTSIRKEVGKPIIDLAHTTTNSGVLERYKQRLSYRKFLQEPIPFKQFSDFLGSLSQIELEGLPKYLYPSAGGIYPVQTYVSIKPQRVEGIPEGIYYYNPQSCQLVMRSDNAYLDRKIHAAINQPIFDESAFSLFLIGDLTTISSLYGEAARDFCLLEAGYMSQLLVMTASEHHIGLCPVGGLDFAQIRDGFMLEESHLLLHSLLGGLVDPSIATGWSFLPGDMAKTGTLEPARPRRATTDFRSFLQEKLPEYMVPSTIMVLDSLPLTANGKVDRNLLPNPISWSRRQTSSSVGSRTPTEETLVQLWSELLKLSNISIEDNFYELGGDSLLATKLAVRIQAAFNIQMPLRVVFENLTIAAMAEAIDVVLQN